MSVKGEGNSGGLWSQKERFLGQGCGGGRRKGKIGAEIGRETSNPSSGSREEAREGRKQHENMKMEAETGSMAADCQGFLSLPKLREGETGVAQRR